MQSSTGSLQLLYTPNYLRNWFKIFDSTVLQEIPVWDIDEEDFWEGFR